MQSIFAAIIRHIKHRERRRVYKKDSDKIIPVLESARRIFTLFLTFAFSSLDRLDRIGIGRETQEYENKKIIWILIFPSGSKTFRSKFVIPGMICRLPSN